MTGTKKAVRPKRAALSFGAAPVVVAPAKAPAPRVRDTRSARPIEVYYWPTGNGRKVIIMLEEIGVPYTIKPVNIGRGDQFQPAFLKISPNNRMPAIVDPDGPGGKPISIFESGAILQYLGRKSGKLYPADERTRVQVEEWLFWQVGGLGPMAGQAHHFRQYAKDVLGQPMERIEYGITRYTNEVSRLYGVLDERLRGRSFVAGVYSIADIAIWPWIVPWQRQGQTLSEYPNLKSWFERIDKRPAVQRSGQVGRDLFEEQRKQMDAMSPAERERFGKMLYAQGRRPS